MQSQACICCLTGGIAFGKHSTMGYMSGVTLQLGCRSGGKRRDARGTSFAEKAGAYRMCCTACAVRLPRRRLLHEGIHRVETHTFMCSPCCLLISRFIFTLGAFQQRFVASSRKDPSACAATSWRAGLLDCQAHFQLQICGNMGVL